MCFVGVRSFFHIQCVFRVVAEHADLKTTLKKYIKSRKGALRDLNFYHK